MNGMDSAARVINGTHFQLWLDNEVVGEAFGLQAKIAKNKTDINMPGKMMQDTKTTSHKGTGTVKMYKTNSRMAIKLRDAMRTGRDVRFLLIGKLADPDSYGAERAALKGVSFDDLTIFDAEAGTEGKVEAPFTFTDFEYLDIIGVQ